VILLLPHIIDILQNTFASKQIPTLLAATTRTTNQIVNTYFKTTVTQLALSIILVLEAENIIVEVIVQWIQTCKFFFIHREILVAN